MFKLQQTKLVLEAIVLANNKILNVCGERNSKKKVLINDRLM